MVRLGGSAVDVAIATMACMGVVYSHNTGVGGGHFMTIYERSFLHSADYVFVAFRVSVCLSVCVFVCKIISQKL